MTEKIKKYFVWDISILVFIGLVMVWSSSWIVAKENLGSSIHFVSKQIIFLVFGSALAFAVSKSKLG